MSEPTYYQLQKQIEKLHGDLAQARMERDTYGESVRMLSEDAKRMRERIVELEKQNETARQQVTTLREMAKLALKFEKYHLNGDKLKLFEMARDALAATEKK